MKKQNIRKKKSYVTITVTHQRRDKMTHKLKWALLLKRHVAVKCIHLTWFLGARGM